MLLEHSESRPYQLACRAKASAGDLLSDEAVEVGPANGCAAFLAAIGRAIAQKYHLLALRAKAVYGRTWHRPEPFRYVALTFPGIRKLEDSGGSRFHDRVRRRSPMLMDFGNLSEI